MPATAAWANPAGCDNGIIRSTSSTGFLQATATGRCAGDASRTIRAEVKRDAYQGRSDYYYGRGFFTTESTFQDSPHTYQHTCN